jgi:hypothetical protein
VLPKASVASTTVTGSGPGHSLLISALSFQEISNQYNKDTLFYSYMSSNSNENRMLKYKMGLGLMGGENSSKKYFRY